MSSPTQTPRTYGGQTAQERREGRRTRLVSAAIRVLGEQGESAATMTAICAEAGLTERYFYESFSGRDEALVAAVDSVADHIAALAVSAIADTSGSTRERVRAALTALVTWAEREPGQARVALVESSSNPALRARRQQLISGFADLVATEAASLYADGVHPQVRAIGVLFAAGIAEVVQAWMGGRLEVTAADVVDLGTEAFERLAQA